MHEQLGFTFGSTVVFKLGKYLQLLSRAQCIRMETITEFVGRKSAYQETIRTLETQKQVLSNQVAELREKVEALELQRQIAILRNEVDALQAEKESLTKRASIYTSSSPGEQTEDPQI
jgi:phage shock protein A